MWRERASCLQLKIVRQHFNLSPLIALCGITHMRIVLPDILDYTLCHYRVLYSVSSMKMSSRVGVRKYLTEYFLRVHSFCHILLGALILLLLYALILLLQKTAVNLHAAHKKTDSHPAHEALVMCFLLLCIKWIITCMQCTKNISRAVHESSLTYSPFHVKRMFWLETGQKLKNTHVFTTHECQLRCELYYTYTDELCLH